MNETEVVTEVVAETTNKSLPVEKPRGFFAEILGALKTRDFWMELLGKVIREGILSFIQAFGGTLEWYGRSKRNKEVAAATGYSPSGDVSGRAFGNGFAPSGGYSTPPNYPVPPSHGDSRFPGFG